MVRLDCLSIYCRKVSAFTKQLNKLKFADGALEVKVL